jgi:hypothetical protein
MPDFIDHAQQRSEEDLERAIAAARGIPALPYVGSCYNCDAITPPGARFCDSDCREDYDKRKRADGLR